MQETFDYPELETHELLCNHLAPKLKGRPRGRRKKVNSTDSPESRLRGDSPGSESAVSEISACSVEKVYSKYSPLYVKPEFKQGVHVLATRPQLRYNPRPARNSMKSESDGTAHQAKTTATKQLSSKKIITSQRLSNSRRLAGSKMKPTVAVTVAATIAVEDSSTDSDSSSETPLAAAISKLKASNRRRVDELIDDRPATAPPVTEIKEEDPLRSDETVFMEDLLAFHRDHKTQVPKAFWLSLKKVNLMAVYERVQKLGGYYVVTDKNLWKLLFGAKSTPDSLITQKKYERALLPFENFKRGQNSCQEAMAAAVAAVATATAAAAAAAATIKVEKVEVVAAAAAAEEAAPVKDVKKEPDDDDVVKKTSPLTIAEMTENPTES